MTVITNHRPRPIIDAWELTEKERQEFDYLDWNAIEEGNESATFFRYKGQLYDLGDFMWAGNGPTELKGWDAYASDSYFSGIVVRYCEDYEQVVVGTFYAE